MEEKGWRERSQCPQDCLLPEGTVVLGFPCLLLSFIARIMNFHFDN